MCCTGARKPAAAGGGGEEQRAGDNLSAPIPISQYRYWFSYDCSARLVFCASCTRLRATVGSLDVIADALHVCPPGPRVLGVPILQQ
jgi:hypothetical protein